MTMTKQEQKFDSIYANHINGNQSTANEALNKLNKTDLVDFINWLNDTGNDQLRKVSTWEGSMWNNNKRSLRLVTVQ